MTTLTLALVIAGIVLCIAASAFFSGSEMALSSCNEVRLENEEKAGSKKAGRALRLIGKFDDALSAILLGNNLVNIAASSLTTVLIILLTGSDRLNWLGTTVVTILVIIFGETMPKILCKRNANRMASAVSGPIQFLTWMFLPINFIVVGITNLLTRGIKEAADDDNEEELEELQSIIDTAEDEGVLDSDRSEMLSAAIDFSDISADEVMTARVDVQAINIDDEPEEILQAIMESTHSRMPVYEDGIDHIIGVVHLNHVLKALAESENGEIDIRSLMLAPCYVYKTMKLPVVLESLKKARQHLAIVIDEYSGTLGVISMEDVLEQIVGDIWDETDTIEEDVVLLNEDEALIDGDMAIADFLELCEIDESDFDYESATVGGWAIEYFGDFPKAGDRFTFRNLTVEVMSMDGLRVDKLRVTREPKKKEDEE